jgi:hypothetical protein
LPWVVYRVNVGMPSPTFFAFVPMRTLAQNDDSLNLRDLLHEAEGEAAERMQQIARAAYAHITRRCRIRFQHFDDILCFIKSVLYGYGVEGKTYSRLGTCVHWAFGKSAGSDSASSRSVAAI